MDGGHLIIHLVDGTNTSCVPEFLVQVVNASSRSITEINAEVLDSVGLLLPQFVNGKKLSLGFLDLLQFAHEVPETGFGDHVVLGEDAHAEDLRLGVCLSGDAAPNDLELTVSLQAPWLLAERAEPVGKEVPW